MSNPVTDPPTVGVSSFTVSGGNLTITYAATLPEGATGIVAKSAGAPVVPGGTDTAPTYTVAYTDGMAMPVLQFAGTNDLGNGPYSTQIAPFAIRGGNTRLAVGY